MFRFANRIPLLFEPGSDVVVKQANDIEWGRYKIDKAIAKIGVFVSVRIAVLRAHLPHARVADAIHRLFPRASRSEARARSTLQRTLKRLPTRRVPGVHAACAVR